MNYESLSGDEVRRAEPCGPDVLLLDALVLAGFMKGIDSQVVRALWGLGYRFVLIA